MQRPDEHKWTLSFLSAFVQGDWEFVDSVSFLTVIPEVTCRCMSLRTGSSTKPPRGWHLLGYVAVPNTPIPISTIQSPTSKGRPRPETGRRGLPLFRDDKSAGIVGYASWRLNVLLSRASQGFQGEARRYVAPWVWSPPRRQVGNQTPS